MIALNNNPSQSPYSALLCSKESDLSGNTQIGEVSYATKRKEATENRVTFLPKGEGGVFLVVANKLDKLSPAEQCEEIRKLGGSLAKQAEQEKVQALAVHVANPMNRIPWVQALLEGILLGAYSYQRFKSSPKESVFQEVNCQVEGITADLLQEWRRTLEGTYFARDLVNEPVITLSAQAFAETMVEKATQAGCTADVFDKAQLEAMNFGGLLGVNRGSIDPPTFTVLHWKPEHTQNDQPLVLVGKGVVYDTGGNNLKSGGYMSTMKSDMGGGAAVAGAMYAIASNNLPVHVIGLVPATDNRIGKNALVADDVITISNGTTVEVQNTDAEGRLILADALAYAQSLQPELVIDMATLTGAAARVTGPYGIAMMGTADDTIKRTLQESGDEVYERCIEFPYWREFDELLKSDIADVKNIGGVTGGATTAGKFLQRFTDYPWIHLDIAGPAFLESGEAYRPVGGTGVGVRLIYDFVKRHYQISAS